MCQHLAVIHVPIVLFMVFTYINENNNNGKQQINPIVAHFSAGVGRSGVIFDFI